MRRFEVAQVSAVLRLEFDGILPALMGPGVAAFTELYNQLKPLGALAEKVTVETPSTRLSDVRTTFSLLQDTVSLRFYYDQVELTVNSVPGTARKALRPAIASIWTAAVKAVGQMDGHIGVARLVVQALAHLRLENQDPDVFLAEAVSRGVIGLRPTGLTFEIESGQGREGGLITVEKSRRFNGALFVDYSARYAAPDVSGEIPARVDGDYDHSLEVLGLAEKSVE